MALTKGRDGRRLSAFSPGWGLGGWFVLRDPSAARPDLTPSITVSGAFQTGNLLVTAGWTPEAATLQAGDFFSHGSGRHMRLYRITQDAVSDLGGISVLHFTPRVRSTPLYLAPVEVVAPGLALRQTQRMPTRIIRADSFRFSVAAREALQWRHMSAMLSNALEESELRPILFLKGSLPRAGCASGRA